MMDTERNLVSISFAALYHRSTFSRPGRVLLKKSYPERKGEIVVALVLIIALLMILSLVYVWYKRYAQLDVPVGIVKSPAGRVEKLAAGMERAGDWRRESRISEAPRRIRLRPGRPGFNGCTIVMAARNGLVLVGNNEDRNHPQTVVTFLPAARDYYGRVVFGYDDMLVQGGMNDRGLFVDGNSLPPTGWKPEPGKPTFRGIVLMFLLGTCATCEDVKTFFETYNVPALERARIPVADRSGASMVVEYGQGGVRFVRSDTWYQIATNFVMTNMRNGDFPCWRYRAADKLLSEAKELSPDLIRDVLEKTHQEGAGLTVYSNIYDLKNGVISLYYLRNFKDVVVLDLAEELEKGERRVDLSSLFKSPGGE